MIYRFLADSVLIVHLLFIGFVVFGGLLALRFRRVALVHIPAACWGAYIELAGGLWPLTTIEAGFHRMAGDAGYSGSFIEHYLPPIIYPAGLARDIRLWLAGLVIRVNVAIYSRLIYRLWLSRAT
jgi:hypothetical protein